MTLALCGSAILPGVAIGQAHLLMRNELTISEYTIPVENVEAEINRFSMALNDTRKHLLKLARKLKKTAGRHAEELIHTHLHMLDDQILVDATEERIRTERCNAEWALQLQLEHVLEEFSHVDDDYIRASEEDVAQVVELLQQSLAREKKGQRHAIPKRLNNAIIVAKDLAPDEVAELQLRGVSGIVLEQGSPHSHSAILARSLMLPMLVGVAQARILLEESEPLIIDGHYEMVFASAEDEFQSHYQEKQNESRHYQLQLKAYATKPSVTLDGVAVRMLVNAEKPEDIAAAVANGAEGVGLYRTEFLLDADDLKDEERQFKHYRDAMNALDGRPLTIRTLDLGADKPIYPELIDTENSQNPALGLRGIRLSLRYPEIFKLQLKAIIRVANHGPANLLIPMICSVDEILAVRNLLKLCQSELLAEGARAEEMPELGGMIEVPAAALAADQFLDHLDFLSIGTNDLVQYLLAVDRSDDEVSPLYDPSHPAVVSMLGQLIARANSRGKPITMCGEMASNPLYTRLLLAMGLRQFSVSPASLLQLRKEIIESRITNAESLYVPFAENSDEHDTALLLSSLNQKSQHH